MTSILRIKPTLVGGNDSAEKASPSLAERSIRRYLIAGVLLVVALVGGIGGIAARTELAGAVIAQGLFVVDSHVKKVQHQTGGIVGILKVRDGDVVSEGDLLARLDDTQTRANLSIVADRLDQLSARRARLLAERDDRDDIEFPADLRSGAGQSKIADLMASEKRLFDLRRTARSGQKAQLESRIDQLKKQAGGLLTQEQSKRREIELIESELVGLEGLWAKNLVSLERVTTERRASARLSGEAGQLVASQAEVQGKISETRLQILQIDQDMRSEVAKDLRDIESQTAELVERKVAAEDQLRRTDIRAPQTGVVHQLSVHTIGGVVGPGEPIMLIVPLFDTLRVQARITPQDIDQVQIGQIATLRLSAFNQRVTPELEGKVVEISPDLTEDQKSGASYYTARIEISPSELAKLGKLKIVPGMPAEAFIQTSSRSIMSYLIKPMHDQFERAFRED
jgi:HlyD family secretion protein